ncbi:MAG TPA: polysaccharide biosynthesis/export family protein, partial [Gemmataceae bacterium]|nr:polysaccharide biosynthesis/export family protein [Gemmataceae bacterium]
MAHGWKARGALVVLAVWGACLLASGCHGPQKVLVKNPPEPRELAVVKNPHVPRELAKVTHPEYVIEPPDILLIDAVRVVPRPPYRVSPLDTIFIRATNVLMEEPINALYGVTPEGTVDLGLSYGSVRVADLTLEEARDAITKVLKETFKNVQVSVSLGQSRAQQQIRGEHLVRPDGTVGLGLYGSVSVVGLTLAQAKFRIEEFLSQFLLNPEVSVDVFSYNSKVYYIITDGGGYGEAVYRFPSTGNETVLDAISQINGLPVVACPKAIWLARPDPHCGGTDQVLPVHWNAITRHGDPQTNYQVLPGDRI